MTVLERKLAEKLGLEDKYEYLLNLVPLYRKLTQALVPPIQTSLEYLNWHLDTEDEHKPTPGPSEQDTKPADVDVDVAAAVGECKTLNMFLNILTTVSVLTGAESLKGLRSPMFERKSWIEDRDNSHEFDFEDQDHDRSDQESARPPFRQTKSQEFRPDRKSSVRASETLPPPGQWTPWEESMIKNLQLLPQSDRALVTLDDVNENQFLEKDRQTLAWHVATKLQQSFDLHDDDTFYARYDAWLVRDVLVQGHVYVTQDSLCYYSLLPGVLSDQELRDPDLNLHVGALGLKKAHYGDSYFLLVYTHDFWAVLKPQTLSIYTLPTKLYFPVKVIDLRKALYCEILNLAQINSPPTDTPKLPRSISDLSLSQLALEASSISDDEGYKENVQSGVWFRIVCADKSYRFHTGSVFAARHWYNAITKAIFQLNNANSQREVLLKIPIEDILSYEKNFVMADEMSTSGIDAPVVVTVKYSVAPKTHELALLKLGKRARNESDKSVYDFVHFLFFSEGDGLYEQLGTIFHDHSVRSEENMTLKRFRAKAKRVFGDDSSDTASVSSRRTCSFVSTLQPEFISEMSLVDKVAAANDRLKLQRQYERMLYEKGEQDPLAEPSRSRFRGMRTAMFSKGQGSGSSAQSLADLFRAVPPTWERNSDFELYSDEGGASLQFPKPFSLTTLRSLGMRMALSSKSYPEIVFRYRQHMRRSRKKMVVENLKNDGSTSESITDENTSSTSSIDSRRKGKLKGIKRSLKTISTMGGVWSANPEHFDSPESSVKYYVEDPYQREVSTLHFRKHFSLNEDAELVATYYAHLKRSIPVYGKLYLGDKVLCFRSLIPGVSTKMILPIKDIENCTPEKGIRLNYSGIILEVHELGKLNLQFATSKARDDFYRMIIKQLEVEGITLDDREFGIYPVDVELEGCDISEEDVNSVMEHEELAQARIRTARLSLLEDRLALASGIEFPLILEDNPFASTEVKMVQPLHFVLLTIGSRGDVQPYIALGKGLIREGHNVTIATHIEFKDWVEEHKINFREVAGDPGELMSLMVSHGSMNVGFLKEATAKFKDWISDLLRTAWDACQGAEVLIESPSAMAGIHIAEALNIPYMRAFTMPWVRTKAYPHAFIVPDQRRGGSYNYLTHVVFENVFWRGISGQVNRWRVETLGLNRTSLVKLQQTRVPFLYNVSPAIFPPAPDFPDWVKVTGYWFLNEGSNGYEPPPKLLEFLETAKKKNKKVVYIGFGSIVVSNAKSLTAAVVDAVADLDVMCILNKGWSDRLSKPKDEVEVKLPPHIYESGSIPHDWLFQRIDAAVHHGGSGTTGATLRSGIPVIIKPFFGDQFFYASRVEDLGVGLALKNLNAKSLCKALKTVTTDLKFQKRAHEIAHSMERETGVASAIEAIYKEMAYAKLLVVTMRFNAENGRRSGVQTPNVEEETYSFTKDNDDDDDDDGEEDEDESEDIESEEEDITERIKDEKLPSRPAGQVA